MTTPLLPLADKVIWVTGAGKGQPRLHGLVNCAGYPRIAAYAASKEAVEALTTTLVVDGGWQAW